MTDKTEGLDEILSRSPKTEPQEKPEAASAAESKPEPVNDDKPAPGRDEKGKFAKANPDPVTEPELTGEKQEAPPASKPQDRLPPDQIPVEALVAVRVEAREAKREAEYLRRQLADLQKPKEQDSEPIDFFTDPDAAIRQSLNPVEQRLAEIERNSIMRASRFEAVSQYGKETVDEVEKFIGESLEAAGNDFERLRQTDPELFQLSMRMQQSQNPVAEAVSWYQRRSVLNEVGDDPVAYRERLKAEILAELQGTQPAAPVQQPQRQNPSPAAMPSNLAGARNVGARTGPAWAGPQPIQDIFDRK